MQDLLIVIGAATIVASIFYIWKLPPVVAFFTAGALVGPGGFGWVDSSSHMEMMTEGAAILLMFTIGLEFSLPKFLAFRRPLLYLGFGQIVLTSAVFTLIFLWGFGFPLEKSIFLSFLVSLSSTAVVLKMLADHRDFETPHGKTAFSVLLSQDIAVIPMIVAIPFLVKMNEVTSSFFESLLPFLVLGGLGLGFFYVLNKFVFPPLFRKVAQTNSREVFFFSIVLLVALLSGGMHAIGLSYSLGAFIAGMFIAGSAYGKQATADFIPLRDAFLGLFFVTIGTLLDFSFVFANFPKILLFGILVLGLKALIIFSVVWLSGNSGTVARISSLLLFQMGEFSFILADQGFKLNLIGPEELQFFIAISIISLTLTPLVYRLMPALSHSERYRKIIPQPGQNAAAKVRKTYLRMINQAVDVQKLDFEDKPVKVLIIGFGVAGRALAKVLKSEDISYRIIETNSETVANFSGVEPIIYGDASSMEILEKGGAETAEVCVIVTSGISTLEPVLASLRRIRSDMPVIARTNYLLDKARVSKSSNVDLVVSEFESTLEVIHRSLQHTGVSEEKFHEFARELRNELEGADA